MADLHPKISHWFETRGWRPRDHQLAMLDHGGRGESALLIAPTGGGKTLSGFLASLDELAEPHKHEGIHTLYISPLKALAVDIARNLEKLTDLPITFWDERLSTVAAERALLEADTSRKRRGEVIDQVAAGFILQGALDRMAHLGHESA